MVGEMFAGLNSAKAALDMARGLQNIHDAVARDRAVFDLQREILAAQEAQSRLIETIGDLKKRVAELETWEADKQRYKLAEIRTGIFCYELKPGMENGEPFHRLCANCYCDGKKGFLQQHISGTSVDKFVCDKCKVEFVIDKENARSWQPYRHDYP